MDIYCGGQLFDTALLQADNNWTYTWYVQGEDPGGWTVTERDVPQGYTVTLRQNGNVFSLINTCEGESEPPQTGDTFSPLPWILLLCISGIMLVIFGIYGRRRG